MSSEIRSEMILVTPEMAKQFLGNNEGNRKISRSRVAQLKSEILNGGWKITHQGIAVSSNGKILDGQHRLLAIVEADRSVFMMVTFNVQDEAFSVIDCGWNRSISVRLAEKKSITEVVAFMVRTRNESHAINLVGTEECKMVISALRDKLDLLETYAPTKTRGITGAGFRAAVLVSMLKNKNPIYSLFLYRALSLVRTEELPPIGHSVIRQSISGVLKGGAIKRGGEEQINTYARGRVALDEDNKNNTVLRIKENGIATAKLEISDLVDKALRGEKIIPVTPIPTAFC